MRALEDPRLRALLEALEVEDVAVDRGLEPLTVGNPPYEPGPFRTMVPTSRLTITITGEIPPTNPGENRP